MVKEFKKKEYWALVLGGSSGLGLASAKKLAKHGYNICIVHRDSRTRLKAVESEFDEIRKEGIDFISYNLDALNPEKRTEIIQDLKNRIADKGSLRVMIHSIARGNLKPLTSNESPTLQNDDFRLTIQAMAISLYDWTKALFEEQLF